MDAKDSRTPQPRTGFLRPRHRDAPTSTLLAEVECWRWDLAELDADLADDPQSWVHAEESRTFILDRIAAASDELARRDRLRSRPGAPAWPEAWWDRRPDATTIKAALSIEAYLAARGVALERAGDRLKARCPLPGHDDTNPSFTIYPSGRGWYCFGCQRGGDLFVLHMHLTGDDDFLAAVDALAAEAGVSAPAPLRAPGPNRNRRRPTFVTFVDGQAVAR